MNENRSNENRCYKLPYSAVRAHDQFRFRGLPVPRRKRGYNAGRNVHPASRLSSHCVSVRVIKAVVLDKNELLATVILGFGP